MLTATLEKMILSGQASFNTFSIGGSQKNILNVKKDHFIIITSLCYQSSLRSATQATITDPYITWDSLLDLLGKKINTQLKVFSNKSNNTFIFRNNYDITKLNPNAADQDSFYLAIPKGHITIDSYLIHESDVSFTLSNCGAIRNEVTSITPAGSIAFSPPFDYGKVGDGLALGVDLQFTSDLERDFTMLPVGDTFEQAGIIANNGNYEFIFPVTSQTYLEDNLDVLQYPLINVQYVEIQGNPTNIQATL